ncbi:hypothetical protein BT96DRAFT_1037005 [Gymnopus androsaceus JB14]|uniref:Uncharacterized protein n=1 Tax=Gymnopus androsaceus JB14 TaxID=1447944 RepID=A0A6A4HGT9_9AGAR|nr:hypothetical protein BT96DRAFT_1037005 [Gymnopus androsaceus JB14]
MLRQMLFDRFILARMIQMLSQMCLEIVSFLCTEFKDCVLPHDAATCWNSTYDMLAAFVEMKDPVLTFLDCSSNGMLDYLLSNEEWEVIEGLVCALKILKDATTFLSLNTPNVAAAIPLWMLLMKHL